MPADTTRLLYLARHAEPVPDGSRLTRRGEQQAQLLGRRLARLPLTRILHGPLHRATETARVVTAQLDVRVGLEELDEAGDYVPHVPGRDELPDAWADTVLSAFASVSAAERSRGAAMGAQAIETLAGPATRERAPVEVVITHAFTIGWLVRHALGAPAWRWWPPTQAHTGLTVIRYDATGPATVAVANDVAHLPEELRWTGVPEHLRW